MLMAYHQQQAQGNNAQLGPAPENLTEADLLNLQYTLEQQRR